MASASSTVLPFTIPWPAKSWRWPTAAEGLELGLFNDLRLRIDAHLQLHHVAALGAPTSRSLRWIFLGRLPTLRGLL